jgi:hypothetical protein
MPRTARASVGGLCYHVINRGNARAEVFRKPEDYAAFLQLLRLATERIPMRILAYCLMGNHFHLALWPRQETEKGTPMKKTVKRPSVSGGDRLGESQGTTLSDTYACSKHRRQWDVGRAIILRPWSLCEEDRACPLGR